MGDGIRHRRDRVVALGRTIAPLLAPSMDEGVDTSHETMKMHAGFAPGGGIVEKQIHQHCLAAPSVAPNVEAANRRPFVMRARLELSDNKWVLAVQASCGLHHVENESLRGPDLRARPDGIAHLTAVISLGPRLLDVWQ